MFDDKRIFGKYLVPTGILTSYLVYSYSPLNSQNTATPSAKEEVTTVKGPFDNRPSKTVHPSFHNIGVNDEIVSLQKLLDTTRV